MSVTERLAGAAERLTELEVPLPDAGRILRRSRQRRASASAIAVAALVLVGVGVAATSRSDQATVATNTTIPTPTPTPTPTPNPNPLGLPQRCRVLPHGPSQPCVTSSYLFDVATRETRPLPPGLVEGSGLDAADSPAYLPSPDGTRVIVQNEAGFLNPCGVTTGNVDGSDVRLTVGNVDGSDARTITPPDGRQASDASWSPDGTKIVYGALGPTGRELFVEDLATGAQTQITHFAGTEDSSGNLCPAFTPDGQGVMFTISNGSVWTAPVSGGEPTLLIGDAALAAPLPDGRSIVYISAGHVWLATIDDPGSARLLTTPGYVWGLEVSPDGTRLLVYENHETESGSISVVDLATSAVVQILAPPTAVAAWLGNDTLIVTQLKNWWSPS